MNSFLSTDAVLHVLSFLPYKDLSTVSVLNKKSNFLTNIETLWKQLLKRDFPDFYSHINFSDTGVHHKTAKEWYQLLKDTELERKITSAYYLLCDSYYKKKIDNIFIIDLLRNTTTKRLFPAAATNLLTAIDPNVLASLENEINTKLRKILISSIITKDDLQLEGSDIGFIGLNLLQTLSFCNSNKLLKNIFIMHPYIAKEEEAASLLSLDCKMLSSNTNQQDRLDRINYLLDLNAIDVDEPICDAEDIAISIRAKATLFLNENQFVIAMINASEDLRKIVKNEIEKELKRDTPYYYGFTAHYALESFNIALKITQSTQSHMYMTSEVKQTFEKIVAMPSTKVIATEDAFFKKLMTLITEFQATYDNTSPTQFSDDSNKENAPRLRL